MPIESIRKTGALLLAVAALSSLSAHAERSTTPDQLAGLPLEQLMQFQIESVSKYPQRTAAAPASVSIVTAADIQTYGYKTLTEILGSMRGLYTSYDRNYSYLGVRGFSVPGDYNSRVLLLVDGVRYNDEVYDQAPLGTDFSIDVDLIERVEFIAGPASAVYGANALLGVINVVTKSGADFRGANIAARGGSFGTSQGRVTLGDSTANGGSWLVSATRSNQRGDDLYFPEFDTPQQNDGVAANADYDRSTMLLAKYRQNGLTITLSHGDRTKGIPTASFAQVFNDRRAQTIDTRTNFGLQYQLRPAADIGLSTRLYGARYEYTGTYIYENSLENRDETRTDWVGGELQMAFTGFERQQIVFGTEYRFAPRKDQKNFDVAPRAVLLDDRRDDDVAGFYLQDEVRLGHELTLNVGVRADRLYTEEWVTSPRTGLVYQPDADTSLKLLYGTAYRTPNAYEEYYFPQFYKLAGPDGSYSSGLKRERIASMEAVLEHTLDDRRRFSFSVFRNDIADLITLHTDPDNDVLYFANDMEATTQGAEFEWQHVWLSGARLKASYSWQQTRNDAAGTLINSPHNLLKANIAGPLWGPLNYGVYLRAVSARDTLAGSAPGYGVIDTTLRSALTDRLELSATLYNLLDHRYFDPGSSEHVQDRIQQNGRSLLVRIDLWL